MEGVAPSPPLLFSHLCSRQHSRIVAATLGLLGKQALIRRVNRVHPSCPSSHRSFSFSFDPSPPFSFPRNIELPRKSRASKGLPSSDSHTTRGGGGARVVGRDTRVSRGKRNRVCTTIRAKWPAPRQPTPRNVLKL